jgi:hypothetical protein
VTVPATGLFVAPCSRDAATFACKAFHYSRTTPSGRCQHWGVWFDAGFDGVAIVSRGSCANIGRPFDLGQDQIAEVTRIALRPGHVAPVSQVLAIVVRLLRRSNPGLELLISYSDQRQQHTGRGVYAACNWTYLGETGREAMLWIHGREVHARTVSSKYGTRDLRWLLANVDPRARRIDCPPKHRWAFALTPTMRERLALLAKPYPKRPKAAGISGCPADLAGAMPSRPLHSYEAPDVV